MSLTIPKQWFIVKSLFGRFLSMIYVDVLYYPYTQNCRPSNLKKKSLLSTEYTPYLVELLSVRTCLLWWL